LALQDGNTKEGYVQARERLQQAIRLDPQFAQAHHLLSLNLYVEWMSFWSGGREAMLAESEAAAERALALDGANSSFHVQYGVVLMCRFEYEQARDHFAKAMELNPNDAKAMGLYGFFLTSVHELDEAFCFLDRAMRLNPLAPSWMNWLRGATCYTARRYPDAVQCL